MSSQIKLQSYVNKVLKQVHPDTGIAASAKSEVENLLNLFHAKLLDNMNLLIAQGSRVTTKSRDVGNAANMVLIGKLGKHLTSRAVAALTRFNASLGPEGQVGNAAAAAGLTFPPSRFKKEIRKLSIAKRVGKSTGVYMAALSEALCHELLKLAGNSSRDNKRVRIKIEDLRNAIEADKELSALFRNVLLPGKTVGTQLTYVKA